MSVRLLVPIVLFAAAVLWILYLLIVKRNWKKAKEVLIPTLFFTAIWAVIYYFVYRFLK